MCTLWPGQKPAWHKYVTSHIISATFLKEHRIGLLNTANLTIPCLCLKSSIDLRMSQALVTWPTSKQENSVNFKVLEVLHVIVCVCDTKKTTKQKQKQTLSQIELCHGQFDSRCTFRMLFWKTLEIEREKERDPFWHCKVHNW